MPRSYSSTAFPGHKKYLIGFLTGDENLTMKVYILTSMLLALVACRAPQARTSAQDPANKGETTALKNEAPTDAVLQDGMPAEERVQASAAEGYAAWYGKELQGKPTASGEMFDMNKMTAAHRDFPMNSLVLVKNTENGKKVIVKVNDRGPYVEGRVMDVSFAAARDLGFAEKGVTKVQLELVQAGEDNFMAKATLPAATAKTKKKKADAEVDEEIIEPAAAADDDEDKKEKLVFLDGKKPKGFTVQVGAFKKKENAERHRDEILESYPEKSFIATNGTWHFICIGDFKTRKKAKEFLKKLDDDGVQVMYRGKVG